MFICNDCLKKDYINEPTIFKSYGGCEVCEKGAVCNDIHHAELIFKLDIDAYSGITMQTLDDMGYDMTHQEEIKESINYNPFWYKPNNSSFNCVQFGRLEILPKN